jgi:hypothetical protein
MRTNILKGDINMAILFSGDFHNGSRGELDLINKKRLLNHYGEKLYGKIKYHIILGDCGFMWPNNTKKDKFNYKELSKRKFPILYPVGAYIAPTRTLTNQERLELTLIYA